MSFAEELEALCREVSGCQAALVMSLDGISVARHVSQDGSVDVETLLVELAGPLRMSLQALSRVDGGDLQELILGTAKGALLIRWLKDEYFVALFLAVDGLMGKARFALRRHGPTLIKELS